MPTNFPGSLDSFTNPAATDPVTGPGSVPHHLQHSNHNDCVAALETKVGANASADPTSLDYKIRNIQSGYLGAVSTLILGG